MEACIHAIALDDREGVSVKVLSWKKVAKALKDNHNFEVDMKQMRNHFDYMKTKYGAWLSLRNRTGNIYDESTNMFNLTEEECDLEILPTRVVEPHVTEVDDDIGVSGTTSQKPHSKVPCAVKNKRKRTQQMDGVEIEILGVLKLVKLNEVISSIKGLKGLIEKKQPKQGYGFISLEMDCQNKLKTIGWAEDDPLYEVALAIFCEPNDRYREGWMQLKAERRLSPARDKLRDIEKQARLGFSVC
ncbi:hypothetical protein CTI12_AA246390 [Artemisia annua]|uniref:Myb/SANT-like domain-containing protein n=1 Tax=Artemisia annua TaxID=35608 RepID=A0A2U1NNF6_ARTAN|nr:hypothetical protein CTI12_AA246390 [Artemisia annua]